MPGRAVRDCVCGYADICDMQVLVAICDAHSVTNTSLKAAYIACSLCMLVVAHPLGEA